MLLLGRQEGHPACKNTEWWGAGVVICLERGADLHTAQLMPLPLTVRLVLPFWYWLTWVVPEKGPLNVYVWLPYQQPMLLMFQPDRSCSGLGYIVASPVFLFWPHRYVAPTTSHQKTLHNQPQIFLPISHQPKNTYPHKRWHITENWAKNLKAKIILATFSASTHMWKWPVVKDKYIKMKPIIYVLFVFDLDNKC